MCSYFGSIQSINVVKHSQNIKSQHKETMNCKMSSSYVCVCLIHFEATNIDFLFFQFSFSKGVCGRYIWSDIGWMMMMLILSCLFHSSMKHEHEPFKKCHIYPFFLLFSKIYVPFIHFYSHFKFNRLSFYFSSSPSFRLETFRIISIFLRINRLLLMV